MAAAGAGPTPVRLDGAPAFPDRSRLDRARLGWWLGLAGVALLIGGSGWYQVWVIPPYRYVDEQAHAGYVLELQAGRLPTIDTPTDIEHGGIALQERLALEKPRRRDVWVANNPPLAYVVAMGPAAISRALGLPGGPLVGLRLVNVACTAAAVVAVARLGAGLAGGDRQVGLVAAGIMAATPHLGFIAGQGFTDGIGLLASVLVLDALVAICRLGPTRRRVALLGLWCAVSAGVRPMTAVLAAAAAAMAVGVVVLRTPTVARRLPRRGSGAGADGGSSPDGSPDRASGTDAVGPGRGSRRRSRLLGDGPAAPVWSAAVLALPAVVLSGWWYLRNVRLYGDATGSDRLFEKFARIPRQGPLNVIHFPTVWREPLRTLFVRRLQDNLPTDYHGWWPVVKHGVIAALVAAAVVVVADQLAARRAGTAPRTSAGGWLAAYAAIAVVVALIAQHWSGGGAPLPRYAFPALAVICVAAALALGRLAGPWPGLGLIAALLALQTTQTRQATAYLAAHKTGPLDSQLAAGIGPEWWRLLGPGAMALGLAALIAGLTLLSSRPAMRSRQ